MARHKYSMYAHNVNKFISRFPDLKYNGSMVMCKICNKPLMYWKANMYEHHIASVSHKRKRKNQIPYAIFLFDLHFTLATCNIPLDIVRKPTFLEFWRKYTPAWRLTKQSTLHRYKPYVRKKIVNEITQTLNDKKLWISVDKTTDSEKNCVANVVVCILNPLATSPPLLLASKRLQEYTGEEIEKLVLSTLQKFRIMASQVLMLVTDGTAPMLLAGHHLKSTLPNLIHVTCILHALHLVSEEVRKFYNSVDLLITNTKLVFSKSRKHIQLFHKHCPNVPEPPEPIFTRWQTWLQTAFYYHKYFELIKLFILQFDANQSLAIRDCQELFQNAGVKEDLQNIQNYSVVMRAITKLQTKSLSLTESLQLVNEVDAVLQTLSDISGVRVAKLFTSAANENPDLARLSNIYMCESSDPLNNYKQHFSFASVKAVDVEQSFSLCKDIFLPIRTPRNEDSVEVYSMLQMFSRATGQNVVNKK